MKRVETYAEYLAMMKEFNKIKGEKAQNAFLKKYYEENNIEPFDFDYYYDPYTAELNLELGSY
jgi:hypothetical protein